MKFDYQNFPPTLFIFLLLTANFLLDLIKIVYLLSLTPSKYFKNLGSEVYRGLKGEKVNVYVCMSMRV